MHVCGILTALQTSTSGRTLLVLAVLSLRDLTQSVPDLLPGLGWFFKSEVSSSAAKGDINSA